MDFATLLGLFSGIGLILSAILIGGPLNIFIDAPSLMIVFGGTFAACFMTFPAAEVKQAMGAGIKVFASKKTNPAEIVDLMVKIADISRREGLIALENVQTESAILKKCCSLIADNADPGVIKTTLIIELSTLKRRHKIGQDIWKKLGSTAPAFGMVGTLIGLVQMLAELSDPEAIGPAMAVAILTTFYGSFLANMIFNPIAGKLRARTLQEELHLQIIFEGANSILESNNPRLVYEKLSSFLPPKERKAAA